MTDELPPLPKTIPRQKPSLGRGERGGGRRGYQPRNGMDAGTSIWLCAWIGVALLIIGGLIIGANWPGTETEYDFASEDTTLVHTGDGAMVGLGLLLAAPGQLLVLLFIIGQGVKLGVLASQDDRA